MKAKSFLLFIVFASATILFAAMAKTDNKTGILISLLALFAIIIIAANDAHRSVLSEKSKKSNQCANF